MGELQHISVSVVVVSDEGIPRNALVHLLQARREFRVIGECSLAEVESARWNASPAVALIHAGVSSARILETIQSLKARHVPVVALIRHRNPWLVHAYHKAGAIGLVLIEGRTVDLFDAVNAAAADKPFLDPLLSETVLEMSRGARSMTATELSARESQVLKYLAYGYSNAQIAGKLEVSTKSVETYRSRLTGKLKLTDRADLVRFALMTGILGDKDADENLAS